MLMLPVKSVSLHPHTLRDDINFLHSARQPFAAAIEIQRQRPSLHHCESQNLLESNLRFPEVYQEKSTTGKRYYWRGGLRWYGKSLCHLSYANCQKWSHHRVHKRLPQHFPLGLFFAMDEIRAKKQRNRQVPTVPRRQKRIRHAHN